jgi:hypothetical protein
MAVKVRRRQGKWYRPQGPLGWGFGATGGTCRGLLRRSVGLSLMPRPSHSFIFPSSLCCLSRPAADSGVAGGADWHPTRLQTAKAVRSCRACEVIGQTSFGKMLSHHGTQAAGKQEKNGGDGSLCTTRPSAHLANRKEAYDQTRMAEQSRGVRPEN